jgi:rhamnosyltransferase subunit B
MDVVVTSFGSDGDFNPLLAIAGALVRQGSRVTFVANPFYERRIKITGSRFVAAGNFLDVFGALKSNPRYLRAPGGMAAVWNGLIAPSIRTIYPIVRDTVQEAGATAVVSHFVSYGGAWAAKATGVRSVIVTTSASGWISRYQPLIFGNWRAPRIAQSLLTMVIRGTGQVLLRRALSRLAVEIGAPTHDVGRTADLNLGVWPEWFRPRAADDPPRSQMCGFVFGDSDSLEPLSARVKSFLAAGDPPIVASFGSAASLHAADRYRAVANACQKLGRRCLLIGPSADTVADTPNVMVIASAPYAKVFPAASMIVHHGGFGTCAEALRAGKPSLVTPFAFDQFDTAARVHDSALGQWFAGEPRNVGALAAALDSTLRDTAAVIAARNAGLKIAAAQEGAARAAELIVAL